MEIDILQFDENVGVGTFAAWLREFGCQVHNWRCDQQQLPPPGRRNPLLLLGGYMGVNDRERLPYLQTTAVWLADKVAAGIPVLAICLGGQLLAHALGAEVYSQRFQEKGITEICLTAAGRRDPLFAGLPDPFVSFEWHNDSFHLPVDSQHLARTAACSAQVFRYQNAWGLQFHPEVDATIVADWCQRTGTGEAPLDQFRTEKSRYLEHSKIILNNYVVFVGEIIGQ